VTSEIRCCKVMEHGCLMFEVACLLPLLADYVEHDVSISLTVCPSLSFPAWVDCCKATTAGLLLWARPVGDIDRCSCSG